jgi:hypothetical protein
MSLLQNNHYLTEHDEQLLVIVSGRQDRTLSSLVEPSLTGQTPPPRLEETTGHCTGGGKEAVKTLIDISV